MDIEKAEEKDFEEILLLIKEEFPYVSFDAAKIRERVEKGAFGFSRLLKARNCLALLKLNPLKRKSRE